MANNKHINTDFNIQILRTVLRRSWYWIIIFPVLLLTLGYFYLRYSIPIYESAAVIQIQENDQGKEILALENVGGNKNTLSKNIELLKSPILFESAVKRLKLAVCFYNKGSIISSQLYNDNSIWYKDLLIKDSTILEKTIKISYSNQEFYLNYEHGNQTIKQAFKVNQKVTTPHFELFIGASNEFEPLKNGNVYFVIKNINSLISQLSPNLKITPLNLEAQTIDVRFESNNATLAKDIVDAVVSEFFIFDEQRTKKSTENVISFLNTQLDSLSKELKTARDSIVYFQQKNKLSDPDATAGQLIQKIDEIDDVLAQERNSLLVLKSIKNRINATTTEKQLNTILIEIQNENYSGTVSGQIEELKQIKRERDLLLTKVQVNNPEIKNKEDQIAQIVANIKQSIEILENKLERSVQLSAQKKAETETEYIGMPQKKIEFSRLKSTEELYDKYYSMLMEKKTQYAITNAGYEPINRVLTNASVSPAPIKPIKSMIYVLCGFLGVIISLGIIAVKYLFYNEIDTVKDIELLLKGKVNVIGELPQTKMDSEHSQIRVKKNKNTRLSEILRSMRTNIRFIKPNYKTISVTSTVSGEGKTFVSLNLASIIAFSDKKTVIIDLDLRKPKIHHAFDVTNNIGASNYLAQQNTIDECIKKTKNENLDLITSGTIPPNPSELILSNRFDDMIAELGEKYDVIVIDMPPVGIVSDGMPVMAKVDIPIYVFRSGYSKREYTQKAKELVELLDFKAINIVVNGVKKNSISAYGTYGKNNYYTDDE